MLVGPSFFLLVTQHTHTHIYMQISGESYHVDFSEEDDYKGTMKKLESNGKISVDVVEQIN